MSKILVLDDDEKLADSIQEILISAGYIVDQANSVEEADPMLSEFTYDALIIDWVMPGMHGIDYVAKLRTRGFKTPILMLTGMNSTEQKISGLENGADDYITKPFEGNELVARVRALLRRPALTEIKTLEVAHLELDPRNQSAKWHGKDLKLTKQEYQIVELLMRHKNEVFSHDALVARAWSSMSESSPDTVRVHMSRLRKKFEGAATECPIKTLHGKGYVFQTD